jgi:hypothetical protein
MAPATIKLYQRVALVTDLPTHGLRKGDVAFVVEHLPSISTTGDEEGYALEVFNAVGETIAVVIVPDRSASVIRVRPRYGP